MIQPNPQAYQALLSDARRRKSTVTEKRDLAAEAASDRGRVLFSTGFRRLQSKTQVFPQEWNAAVRTRLTHSLEVASIGRYLAEGISDKLIEQGFLGNIGELDTTHRASAFISFVEVSCLMHDLGNPPFGHFGEKCIQEWFAKRQKTFGKKFADEPTSQEFNKRYQDFLTFDGNPQGFRLATRLQWVNDAFGYNLTYSQLAATLKYPWTPERIGTIQDDVTIKKAGVFHSEAAILREIQQHLKLSPLARHPLAYVMEAADDISYCLSDMEDALEKRVITNQQVIIALQQGLSQILDSNRKLRRHAEEIQAALPQSEERLEDHSWFVRFRTTVTNVLVRRACALYLKHHDNILKGEYFTLLERSITAEKLLETIKKFSEENLYCDSVVRERELVGYQVVSGILDRFGLLLDLSSKEAEALLVDKAEPNSDGFLLAATLESFLPRKHLKVYKSAIDEIRENEREDSFEILEWMARAHLIVDFISGMTDDFAIVTYRRLYDAGSTSI